MYNPQDILDKNNIVEIISQVVPLKRHGKDYFGCCPFHNEKSPSFTVNEAKQFFYCFGCGASGNAINFIMDYHRVDFKEACKELGGEINQDTEEHRKKQAFFDKIKAPFIPPSDHEQDYGRTKDFLDNCKKVNGVYVKGEHKYKPMINGNYMALNVYRMDGMFLLGGITYGAGLVYGSGQHTYICLDIETAKDIASNKNNKAIAVLTEENLRICALKCRKLPLFSGAMVDSTGIGNECLIDDLQHERIIVI